jgi:hypothetical protein
MARAEKVKLYGRVYTLFLHSSARIRINEYTISISPNGEISIEYRLYGRGDGYMSSFSLLMSITDGGEKLKSFLKTEKDSIKGIIESIKQKRRLAVLAKLIYLITTSLYDYPITKTLKSVTYYHQENELYYERQLSVNAFLKGIYRERHYFSTLLETLGLSWPTAYF